MTHRVAKGIGDKYKGFSTICAIGKGTFGQVYKVKKIDTKELYAIKVIDISTLDPKDVEHSEAEVRNLKALSHVNLVRYVADFREDCGRTICIVMELCDCTLRSYMKKQECKPNELEVNNLICQVSRGLQYMHDRDVLHRDIKPTNILVCGLEEPNPVFKLADFGLARDINVPVDGITKYVGTRTFMSPEMIRSQSYNKPTDIWSLACCLYEVTNGIYSLVDERGKPKHERSWDNWTYSEDLKALLQSMFQLDPDERPTVNDILEAIETKRHSQKTRPDQQEIKSDPTTPRKSKARSAKAKYYHDHSLPANFSVGGTDESEPQDTPRDSYVTVQVQVKMSKGNADYLKAAEQCYMSLVEKLHSDKPDKYMDQIEAAIDKTKYHTSEDDFLTDMKLLLRNKYTRCEVYLKNYRNYMSALYKTPLMPSFRGFYSKKR
ncbi:serine/threonine-protein kinase Nek7-like [Dreissena polymorpha]|uniref:serine/threonine-protein kinase Nek7-like n=1 Tax=Dreissena polymorpha TaxID=45954 RepID=UPI0022648133|nr:serine/threonine-protein kinase Nek7-like [Dreissena polymorpha]